MESELDSDHMEDQLDNNGPEWVSRGPSTSDTRMGDNVAGPSGTQPKANNSSIGAASRVVQYYFYKQTRQTDFLQGLSMLLSGLYVHGECGDAPTASNLGSTLSGSAIDLTKSPSSAQIFPVCLRPSGPILTDADAKVNLERPEQVSDLALNGETEDFERNREEEVMEHALEQIEVPVSSAQVEQQQQPEGVMAAVVDVSNTEIESEPSISGFTIREDIAKL
ncbi:hypothetical protein GHT06_006577 [Daphnia sinensis]|uniref:Uncharacterized protein n=1 Tax=Daphnia sinensis TaxID=1820382 RepID=A0AAD5KDA8_9CRUS|nr:hypothetical protein GHT06_006577 [Daphnia sinensis]